MNESSSKPDNVLPNSDSNLTHDISQIDGKFNSTDGYNLEITHEDLQIREDIEDDHGSPIKNNK